MKGRSSSKAPATPEAAGGEQTGGSSGGRQCARVRRDIQLHGLLLSWGAEASHPCVTTSSRRHWALPSFRRVVCVRQPVTAKGSHDSGVCQRDGQQPSLFGARNIRPVNSAASTSTYVSLTGARSSANMAGRAVRKRPAAEIWPPEPKCVGRIRVGLTCSRGVARVPASQVAVVWCLGVRSRLP